MDRHLAWDGCWNARDLGGLRTGGGLVTRLGSVVRSESLHLVSPAGWKAIEAYGVRTLVDFRNPDQCDREPQAPPPSITIVNVALEDGLDDDPEFARWRRTGQLGTPLYFGRFLERWPERVAAAVAAVARARPGAVVVQCGKGADRTGLVVMVVLALVGVTVEDIVADYQLTGARLVTSRARRLGRTDDLALIESVMAEAGTTTQAVLSRALAGFRIPGALLDAGLGPADVDMLRQRLLDSVRSF